METKRKFVVQILSVVDWETDDVEFAATASHEGDDATLEVKLEECQEKTKSETWNESHLKQKTVTFEKTLDRDTERDETETLDDKFVFDELVEAYRDQLEDAAVELLRDRDCRYDILKPVAVEIKVIAIDGRVGERLAAEKKSRDILLYCMNIIMRHLNDEDAQESWLTLGVPDGTAVEEPGEELTREIADLECSNDEFESMLRVFVRTLATEVFPNVMFGDPRYDTKALY